MSPAIQIDLDKLLDQALKGVRRASVFMGLGVNAALDSDFNNYQLTRLTNIQIIPDDISDDTLHHFKEEFRLWIEAGGFRELVETFSVYLDSVYHVCLLFQAVRQNESTSSLRKRLAKFQRTSYADKLDTLSDHFSVVPFNHEYLISLNRARNCLTHRRGIVSAEDIGDQPGFAVCWQGWDVFGQTPSGERRYLNEFSEGPVEFPEGACIMAQFVERRRCFAHGDKLVLSTRDLAEICMYYQSEARHVTDRVVAYAEGLGIQINRASS